MEFVFGITLTHSLIGVSGNLQDEEAKHRFLTKTSELVKLLDGRLKLYRKEEKALKVKLGYRWIAGVHSLGYELCMCQPCEVKQGGLEGIPLGGMDTQNSAKNLETLP